MTENPVLEEVSVPTLDEPEPVSDPENRAGDSPADELRFDETIRSLDKIDEGPQDGLYPGEDLSLPEAGDLNRRKTYQEALVTHRESLFEYLLWQIGCLDLTAEELEIAEEIVGNLNRDGYLTASLEEIARVSRSSTERVEKILKEIQGLDPAGIAAQGLQQSLLLQLARKYPDAELAKHIVKEHLPLLVKKQWDLIAKRLKARSEETEEAARIISSLDPRPGRSFYGDDPVAVKPDASVTFDDEGDKLEIEIHDEELPELRVSPYYRRMLKDPKLDPAAKQFVKEKLQAAIDFLRALGLRRSTLRAITEEIVKAQAGFFEAGFSQLKPLRLKDIAEAVGIHESTVSRALQGKYISTPQGTIPYKSFFSSKVDRVEGGEESQKSMMEKIRALIHAEDPHRPLSDQALTRALQQEGIVIARRTVAKYRELLKILPSHLRGQK